MERRFPAGAWPILPPSDQCDEQKLAAAARWLDVHTEDRPYRVAVLRRGRVAGVWRRGIDAEAKRGIASGRKTLYGCMLAIAVEQGKIGSADDRVVDYFPQMMDVPEGRGPKPGRHAIPEDREITFRQLITNTSGYLKPDERPGSTFHYQTFGMNLLTHAIEQAYGCYEPGGGGDSPGFGRLVQREIGDPIGATFGARVVNFAHPPEARIDVFGNGCDLTASLWDWARVGYLWLNGGRWVDAQVVPRPWMMEATRTAELVKRCSPEERWCYGYAFWTNDHHRRWPGLPRDAYSASGAGYNFVWVCPSLDLIVVQNPGGGPQLPRPEERGERVDEQLERERRLLERIVDACV